MWETLGPFWLECTAAVRGCLLLALVAQALNRDHKPDEVDEASRVLSNGGRIESFKGRRG